MDESAGYERIAEEFVTRRSQIGAHIIREWAVRLPFEAAVLDLGCGHGVPISQVLLEQGHQVYGIDASPTLVAAFRRRFRGVNAACESVQSSGFFDRKFAGVVAWGLMFLLPAEEQEALIQKVAAWLAPGGRFLFTAPHQACEWEDVLTGRTSVSLGRDRYCSTLEKAGLVLVDEGVDDGENHYFEAAKPGRG